MKEERIRYIDILRGLATIGVIVIHVSANNWYGYIGSKDWIIFTIYEGMCKVAVPLFFMISGCLFLSDERNMTLKYLYKSHILKMIIFLIFWSAVYKFANNIQIIKSGQAMLSAFTEILAGNTQIHLWYIYSIIGLYLITPVLKIYANNSSKTQLLYGIICCFCIGPMTEFLQQFSCFSYLTNNLIRIKGGMEFGYIGYYLLGYYIKKYEIVRKNRICIYFMGFLCSIVTIGLVIGDCMNSQSIMERFWSYTMPCIAIASAAVFIFIKYKNIRVKYLANVLEAIAKRSLGIYGCHFLFVMVFWKVGITTFSFPGIISVPIISAIVLLLSYYFSVLINKIPFLGKYIA